MSFKISKLWKFVKKNKIKLILGLIFLIGIILRFYQLDRNVWQQTGYDESRDMLVARHIIQYGEVIARGPLAAGGHKILMNSPVYYYFISFLWLITQNPIIFMYVWTSIMSSAIVIGYFVGKKLDGKKAGLILASLIAINPHIVFGSRELLQPHLLIVFSLLFIWAILSFFNKKEHRYALLATFFLLTGLHFHYGVLLILPVGMLWLGKIWLKINNFEKLSVKKILGMIVTASTVLASWIFLTYQVVPLDQFYFLIFNQEQTKHYSFLVQIKNSWLQLTDMIWQGYSEKLNIIGISFFILILIAIQPLLKKSKKIFFISSIAISSLILASCFQGYISKTYLSSALPFFLILLTMSFKTIINKLKVIGWGILFLNLIIITNSSLNLLKFSIPQVSFYNQQQQVAKSIYLDYLNLTKSNQGVTNQIPEFRLVFNTTLRNMPFDGWGTSGAWFFLEQLFNQKLVKLTNYGVSHTPLQVYPKYIYLICDHRYSVELIQTECISRFIYVHPYIKKDLIKIDDNAQDFSVWRGNVDDEYSLPIMNRVHRDLYF